MVTARTYDADAQVRLVLSKAMDFSSPKYSPSVISSAACDRVVRLEVSGLTPATTYYYRLEVNGVVNSLPNRTGTFKTFPNGASNLTIGFGACSDIGLAGLAFTSMLDQVGPDLFINMGDMHYEDTNTTNVNDYRNNYKKVFENEFMASLYRNVASSYVWDDHDYCGNNSDRTSIGRGVARQAYREWVPHYAFGSTSPVGAIYQAFTIGRVRIIMTDLRSESDPASTPDGPSKTKMGSDQKKWFMNQLLLAKSNEVPLIAWVSSVPWIEKPASNDRWAGFADERREIANFIRDNRIQNVILLSGDMHALAYDDGTNSDYATGGGAPVRVFQSAGMGKYCSHKGGPYTGGPIPADDRRKIGPVRQLIASLRVVDAGGASTLGVEYKGFDAADAGVRIATSFVTEPVRPLAADGFQAVGDLGRISLTWKDRSTVESGYVIERSDNGIDGWTEMPGLPANSTSVIDANVVAGKTFYYRLRAVHGTPPLIFYSDYTAVVSATPVMLPALQPAIVPINGFHPLRDGASDESLLTVNGVEAHP